ncbi:MFS transporter [Longispora albida]|uniref:MFS transporter n=1 Tax=Longispora albida TaxID=203523 RepID=UPI0006866909|nr:MFS transporter [Longispora albida]
MRFLLVNQFAVNVGFYLLVPFLAGHLSGAGLAAGAAGLVLGVRTLSQQGMFLLGGSLADRLGCRPVIIAGCALRTLGFGLFAVLDSLPGLILASALAGLAGALFNPAVRAYVAVAAGERKAEAFARFNVYANAGALAGPLLGAALIGVGFRLVAVVAALIFAALTVAQMLALPPLAAEPAEHPLWKDWAEVLSNRRFVLFALAGSGMYALYSQLYLALPLAAGPPWAVSGVFLLATVISIAGQVRITRWCRGRWRPGQAIAAGLGVMGLGFCVPVLPGPWAVFGGTALLAAGYAMAHPFALELIPGLGADRLPGTYFGAFYLVSGVVAAAGSAGIGWALDASPGPLAWVLLAAAGLASAAGVAALDRKGQLA